MCTSPPYLPLVTQLCGTTYGFSGSRSSTFGSLPAFTRSASIGASVNDAGLGSTSDGEPLAPVAPACPSLAPGVLPASSPQLASSIVPATAAAAPNRTCRRPTSPWTYGHRRPPWQSVTTRPPLRRMSRITIDFGARIDRRDQTSSTPKCAQPVTDPSPSRPVVLMRRDTCSRAGQNAHARRIAVRRQTAAACSARLTPPGARRASPRARGWPTAGRARASA